MSKSPQLAVSHGYGAHEPAGRVRRVRYVARPPDAGLAEVVPAGPGEVADHVRVLAHQLPVRRDSLRAVLAADDHAVRVQLVVHRVARLGVVVPATSR